MAKMGYTYIDLFSGAGGMSLGFEQAGFHNLFSIEFNEVFAATYRRNFPKHKLIVEDIKKVSTEVLKYYADNSKVDVIIGGPPCQGFSLAGNIARNFIDDERNSLFKEFVRVVEVFKPSLFVFENVANLEKHNKGKTIKEITEAFAKIGYSVKYKVLLASEYGIPQNRRRLFVIGQNGKNNTFTFPKTEEKKVSIKEAIDDLPALKSGETSNIPNHSAMKHSEQMLKKMSFVPDGGDRFSIPETIRPMTGDIRKYIRYKSDEPSFCVTGDMRKIFHYSQNRALTCRELARLQTFPDNFIFEGSSIEVQQQIGNAVPVELARKIAICVKMVLEDEKISHN